MSLQITQVTREGHAKTWKLPESAERFTFGTSRKARLYSIDSGLESYQCVFEYRDHRWHCLTFDTLEAQSDRVIENSTRLQLGGSVLEFSLSRKEPFVLENLLGKSSEGVGAKKMVLVIRNETLLASFVLNEHEDFKFFSGDSYQIVPTPAGTDWHEHAEGETRILSRKVAANGLGLSAQSLAKLEPEAKKAAAFVLLATLLIVGISFLVPRSETKALTRDLPKTSPSYVVKTEIHKKALSPGNPATDTGSGSTGKSNGRFAASVGLRISQLLRKVSSTEARTANVIYSQGLKAGDAPSGRALSALGKTESSGRNWSGEAAGKAGGVSTAGVGGGRGAGSLSGTLGQGKTGTGGVGLLEDESEIIGGLDREVIAQYIKTQLGQILYCYERQLSATPELYGKVAVKFTISGSGQVETQSINDTTLKNRSVESCILNKIARWKFPEPKGGTKVLVTYPFLFKSTI